MLARNLKYKQNVWMAEGLRESTFLTLFSMGYFKNTTVWGGGGHYGPPPNFVVSSSITIKFVILIKFDKISPK